jgi:glutathione synthase/RimK-type ligase-like ATP-grasp enzyme
LDVILIVAPEEDVHACCVAQHLSDMGAQAQIVDLSTFANSAGFSQFLSTKPARLTLTLPNGSKLDPASVDTVWYRRPRLPQLSDVLAFESDRDFAGAEWGAVIDGFVASLSARFVNDPVKQRGATKPRQLQVAEKAGLAIPATLITNNADEARGFVEKFGGRVIHKPLTAPRNRFLATKRWSDADKAALENLKLVPTIFQEEIQGSLDLRITVMGQKLFAASFSSTKLESAGEHWIDNRLNLDVEYREHRLPAAVESCILTLMRGLDLSFGTVDMKVDERGDYVFLEVNPQGQFLYIDILTGLPLAKAMAEFLIAA